MKILEDLWYGNINPYEQCGYLREEDRKLLELYKRNHDKLNTSLNAEEKETLEKLYDCWSEMQQNAECHAFTAGFQLAVQLMTAAVG